MAAASPARNPDSGYQAWGYSSVVDPWGKVIAGGDGIQEKPGTVFADIDMDAVEDIRWELYYASFVRFPLWIFVSPRFSRKRDQASSTAHILRKQKSTVIVCVHVSAQSKHPGWKTETRRHVQN